MTQNDTKKLKLLGITGGIASGKSTVSEFLRKKNGLILDADKISHSVIIKGKPAYGEVLSAITGEYLDENGEIDRRKLGDIVFKDREALKRLEAIIHSHALKEIYNIVDDTNANPNGYRFIVIDAPLLIESGWNAICDAVWVIRAEYDLRVERIIARNGLTKEQAIDRINIQTNWQNLQNESFIFIDNNGNEEDLLVKVYEKLVDFLE